MDSRLYEFGSADQWDAAVLDSKSYCFFHSMAWARVLHEAYGFRPCHVRCREGDAVALVPLMEVRIPLRGARAVCLPFSDACGPIFGPQGAPAGLASWLQHLAARRGWARLEVREDCGLAGFSQCALYREHVVDLGEGLRKVSESLRSSTWRNIQRAEREGIEVVADTSLAGVEEYYRLHCITRKRLGVPPQPRSFFAALHQHAIARGNGRVFRARFRGVTIAASVFLHFGRSAIYKFGASLPDRGHLRPNNILMWRAVEWLADRGFDKLSLGRTDPDDEGLMQFKNGWGADCRDVRYICSPPPGSAVRGHRSGRARMLMAIARRLPIPVLRLAGTIAYRYVD